MRRRWVRSGDVELAVWDSGQPSAGASSTLTILAVHGYPDTHALWDPVIRRLAQRSRVVAYDVRGAGESTAPAKREGYAVGRLVEDLAAVLDATVGGGGRVHLVGHDWGSVQLWEAVLTERSDPRLTGRLASFTSISGPSLGQFSAFLRGGGAKAAVAAQLLRSAYVGLFLLPWLPVVAMRAVAGRTGANGINLYRANVARAGAQRAARTTVPVQLVVATRDPFLSPAVYAGTGRWAEHLERVDVNAGHWAPRTHPDLVAELVRGFVERLEVDH